MDEHEFRMMKRSVKGIEPNLIPNKARNKSLNRSDDAGLCEVNEIEVGGDRNQRGIKRDDLNHRDRFGPELPPAITHFVNATASAENSQFGDGKADRHDNDRTHDEKTRKS